MGLPFKLSIREDDMESIISMVTVTCVVYMHHVPMTTTSVYSMLVLVCLTGRLGLTRPCLSSSPSVTPSPSPLSTAPPSIMELQQVAALVSGEAQARCVSYRGPFTASTGGVARLHPHHGRLQTVTTPT